MSRAALLVLLLLTACLPLASQSSGDAFKQALAQGDLYQSRKKFDLALDAYHKADKLCHHSSASCYLKIASVERKLGALPDALEDAKRAEKASTDNKTLAVQAHVFRATLLTQMSAKPADKKLREAEDELRQAIALDATAALAHFDLAMVLLKQERDPEGLVEMNGYIALPNADPATIVEARRIIANPVRARAPFAPDFSFTTSENERLSNVALRGKVVLLDFWGTWCPPCRESIPAMRNLQKKFAGKNLQMVGISSDEDEEVWKTFTKAQQMTWSEYIDLSGEVQKAFSIDSFPTYIVLDKDGVIRYRQSGFGETTQGDLEEAINKALKRESDPKLAAAALAGPTETPSPTPPATSNAKLNSAAPTVQPAASSNAGHNGPASGNAAQPATPPPLYPGIEGGIITGTLYKNQELGFSYEFPSGWIPATADALHSVNERAEANAKAAILQQRPGLADSVRVNVSKIVFYASRKGNWDGQRYDLPSIRITAVPTRSDEIDADAFDKLVATRAAASGMKVIGGSSMFEVNKHRFYRADFDHAVGAVHVYRSLVQTIAANYLLDIEFFAYSTDELNQAAASLKAMSVNDVDQ